MTTDEISAAFDHPEVRAGGGPLDRISLRDHVREVEVGAFESERGRRQRLRFDLAVEVGPVAAGDDVDRVLSYDRLVEAIDAALGAGRASLLETLAERVAARVLAEPQARRAFLRVQKLDRGPGALGVEIVRAKGEVAAPPEEEAPRPRVAVLGPTAMDAGALGEVLDKLLTGYAALVLCSSVPDERPRAATAPAQRRVDLLALDQAAWVLASRDARLSVASSRTELDWALRQGRPVVWAPTRMVLDAAGLPDGTDGSTLAAWLAGLLRAVELRLVAAEPPKGLDIAVPVARGTVAEPLA